MRHKLEVDTLRVETFSPIREPETYEPAGPLRGWPAEPPPNASMWAGTCSGCSWANQACCSWDGCSGTL